MPITPEFVELVNRPNQELDQTEARATKGLELVRDLLARFPNNVALIQYFAYLNTALLFIETSKSHIQSVVEAVRPTDISLTIIFECGENLSNLLGKVLETKLRVEEFITYLER